jgi:hypothetical protein
MNERGKSGVLQIARSEGIRLSFASMLKVILVSTGEVKSVTTEGAGLSNGDTGEISAVTTRVRFRNLWPFQKANETGLFRRSARLPAWRRLGIFARSRRLLRRS